jgi:hypothetical protein
VNEVKKAVRVVVVTGNPLLDGWPARRDRSHAVALVPGA